METIKINSQKIKSDANFAHKEANLSLFAVLNYLMKSNEKNLVAYCKAKEINRKNLTIDFLKSKMTEKELNKVNKAGEILEPRKLFSLYTVLTAICRK